jgi:hypothetical protein
MAVILPNGKNGFITSAGLPLNGGKLFTYDTGTATPRPTYADAGAVTPNANPIILDSRGEALIYWSGVYRIILQDSAGNVIWPAIDNIVGSSANSNTLLGLTDGPGSYAGAASFRIGVNPGATGFRFIADTFTNLTDTFASYAGKALQVLRVNAAMTAIETAALTLVSTFLTLTDLSPQSYTGKAGQSVVVNTTETGVTFDGAPLGDACFVLSAGLAVVGATPTALPWGSTEYTQLKRGSFAAGVYTAPSTGCRVKVGLSASVAAVAAFGTFRIWIEKNSATKMAEAYWTNFAGGTAIEAILFTGKEISLAAGETLRAMVNCSLAQTIDSTASKTFFTIQELG